MLNASASLSSRNPVGLSSQASAMAEDEILVCDDPLISVEYRSAMVGVLGKKALITAREDLP